MQRQFSTPVRRSASFRTSRRYEQPTIASKSRSPSPYTNRRMCQLSEDSKQRLAHLNLGPYEFKRETDCKPPFVVRHTDTSQSPDTSMTSCSTRGTLRSQESSNLHDDLSVLDSYRPSPTRDSHRMHVDDLQTSLDSDPIPLDTAFPHRAPFSHSAPSSFRRHPSSPVLNRSSLRERFQTDHRGSANWEEIHSRVKNLLKTHSARQRLVFDMADPGMEPRTSSVRHTTPRSPIDLHDSPSRPRDTSVHLGGGEFWCNKASAYKGKSHRVVFEESMEKIYRNMYRKASSPQTHRRPHTP